MLLVFRAACTTCLLICLIRQAYSQTPVVNSPAVELRFPTENGKFYQIQIRRDDTWHDVGTAIVGDGRTGGGFYPAGQYRVTSPSDRWAKVWADEFDKGELDYGKWSKEENNYGGGNNERQAYRTESKYCFVKDGVLNLAVHRDAHTTSDGKTQPYSSARIRTRKRGDWTYGRFEIRAKMPGGQGIWPAIWMLPTDSRYGQWAACGEIDIVESRGSATQQTNGALHFGDVWPGNKFLTHRYTFPDTNSAEAFHTYTLEWSEDSIKWFVDDHLCQTRTADEWFTQADRNNQRAPFDQPFHLVINVAVDGRYFDGTGQSADRLPDDAFPQTLQIDYVRVYQWAP